MAEKGRVTAMEKSEPNQLKSEKLFNCLYQRYYEMAFNNALFYCESKEMAEDVVQDVFLKLWQNIESLRLKIKYWKYWRYYLFVITRNKAINSKRDRDKERTNKAIYSLILNEAVFPDLVREKECDLVFTCALLKLSYQQREVFILKYYSFKRTAIAKGMKISTQCVTNTLVRARKQIYGQVKMHIHLKTA
jgi:RNA polymerase sigma-70 factor (ECF subfamily)